MKQSYVELNYLIWSSQACDKYLTLAFSLQLFPRRTSWELSISLSSTTHTWTQVRQVKQPQVRPAWSPDLEQLMNYEGRSVMSIHTEWGEAFWKGNEWRVWRHIFFHGNLCSFLSIWALVESWELVGSNWLLSRTEWQLQLCRKEHSQTVTHELPRTTRSMPSSCLLLFSPLSDESGPRR